MFLSIFLSSCVLLTAQGALFTDKIKHVVALMFENRAFDHLIGYMHENRSEIDGCVASLGLNCSNPLNSTDPSSQQIPVGPSALYVQPGDPSHSYGGTTHELFGSENANTNVWPPPMNGFVDCYRHIDQIPSDEGKIIMQGFDPSAVPIITTLADNFLLFDRWFADVPACTDPNRVYSWLSTSAGMDTNNLVRLIEGFREMSIFEIMDQLIPDEDPRVGWKSYFHEVPSSAFVDYVRLHPKRWGLMENFYQDLENEALPVFSWIDPSYSATGIHDPATDQHPDHDVRAGEAFLKEIYEKLRNSTSWEKTLFLIFYDEHGGFFDHVPPPLTVNPDGKNAPNFNFDRLGLRIPAVIVSPWVGKGVMAPKPDPSSVNQYSHSSLLHTMRTQFSNGTMPAITKRDQVALGFADLVDLDSPRTDCIVTLPDVPGWNGTDTSDSWKNPINDWQISLAMGIAKMCGPEGGVQAVQGMIRRGTTTERQIHDWMATCTRRIIRESR